MAKIMVNKSTYKLIESNAIGGKLAGPPKIARNGGYVIELDEEVVKFLIDHKIENETIEDTIVRLVTYPHMRRLI